MSHRQSKNWKVGLVLEMPQIMHCSLFFSDGSYTRSIGSHETELGKVLTIFSVPKL